MAFSTPSIRIATRSSPLALWQAQHVKQALIHYHPQLKVELVQIKTQGDKILDVPLAKIGGKGLFVKELEQAMLNGQADIAVHSMKDVPMEFPTGLGLAVIGERGDHTDALVSNHYKSLDALPLGARVGTSSLRRQVQLKATRPDLSLLDLRGNVHTRLAKLDAGDYDAIVLASAGLKRLGMATRIAQSLPITISLPAGGQGAIGIETRVHDASIQNLLAPLQHQDTADRILAERALNNHLQGGCQVPIACYATLEDNTIHLKGLVGNLAGTRLLRAELTQPRTQADSLGVAVAQMLLQQGAGDILAEVYAGAEPQGQNTGTADTAVTAHWSKQP